MEKVLVALSGGVDSAVSAALLKEQGYEVVAAFMKVYSTNGGRKSEVGGQGDECWVPEYRDAVRVSAHLNIPLVFFDFEREYRERVLEYLFAEYAAGRTPNPDVLCNKYVKFTLLLREADKMGIGWIATGHYARTRESTNHKTQNTNKSEILNPKSEIFLLKGMDPNKDQSYFLHQLTQDQLSRTMFPVGEMTKTQVRTKARELGLPVADKRSTRGICFVGKVNMPEFLSRRIAQVPGPVVTARGREIGAHHGLAPYTVGQRQGIGIGGGVPFFVVEKRFESNTLVVAEGKDDPALYSSGCVVRDMHWIAGRPPLPLGKKRYVCEVKLRYRHPGVASAISQSSSENEHRHFTRSRKVAIGDEGGSLMRIAFETPQRAVTPGQFAVLYDGELCLGGGVIEGAQHA